MSKKKYLSIEETVSLPNLSDINISNNGENVAFVKKIADYKDNKFKSYVWIYEKDKEICNQLTSNQNESSNPIWSKDSQNIAYLSKNNEEENSKNQIFIKTISGYSGIQVTNEKEGIINFKWAPDGKGFYFIKTSEESKDIKKRKEIYGDFEYIDKEYKNNGLYYIDIKEGINSIKNLHYKAKRIDVDKNDNIEENFLSSIKLTDNKKMHVINFEISPNGEKIAFTALENSNMESYQNGNLYILDVYSKEVKMINKDENIKGNIKFSPDGEKICFTCSPKKKEYYYKNVDDQVIEIYDFKTKKSIRVAENIDRLLTPIEWNDRGIIVEWQEKSRFTVGILDKNNLLNEINDIKNNFIMGFSETKTGEDRAYIKAEKEGIFEVYFNNKKITNDNSIFKDKLKSKKEMISWKSSDDLDIEGVLSLPHDFDKSKKYPLLVVIHGGPTWASFPIQVFNKLYPIEQFVEKGFIVLEPNYRGSSGYGRKFLKANYKNLGIGDYEDVISGVDSLIEKGIVDNNKIGVMGWSQGGYISAFCSTYSDRFKAISVGAGISNWITYYVNTDIHHFTRMYLGDTPWNNEEIYKKTSPMTYIKSACTPTLIQHGEKDTRVPVPNAYELYQGLKDIGVETELVIFKGMNHAPIKPGLNRAIMEQNFRWFNHHVLGEEI